LKPSERERWEPEKTAGAITIGAGATRSVGARATRAVRNGAVRNRAIGARAFVAGAVRPRAAGVPRSRIIVVLSSGSCHLVIWGVVI
jgi:hypothetical protein